MAKLIHYRKLIILSLWLCFFQLSSQNENQDRTLKKRADDAWFLEKSAWPPMPYDYGYEVRDLEGNEQYKSERSDGSGRVTGSYGYFGPDGIYRHVDYVADERGFRAQIRTSEPGVAAQNPANVKIITEPLLPQRVPSPGGRILRPIESSGVFDSSIIGDPILEKGLSYIPGSEKPNTSENNNKSQRGSNFGNSDKPNSSTRGSNSRGSSINSGSSPMDNNLSRNPYFNRELAQGRDPSIVTRDPSSLTGIDDILGINGRGIMIPIERQKSSSIDSSQNNNQDNSLSQTKTSPASRSKTNSNIDLEDALRSREIELREREKALAAKEQSLMERDRSFSQTRQTMNGGTKGGSRGSIGISSNEFVKRRDISDTMAKDTALGDASTIDKEADEIELVNLVKKNDVAINKPSSNENMNNSNKETSNKENNQAIDEIESIMMNKPKNGNQEPVKVFISEGPMKESNNSPSLANGSNLNERERESVTKIQNGMKDNSDTKKKPLFEPTDQQISHLKFDDDTDKIAKYKLKPEKKSAYLRSYNHQYQYPIDYQNDNTFPAVQLKKSYPKNYQQYRLLRNRLPRDRPYPLSKNQKQLTLKSNEDKKQINSLSSDESLTRVRYGGKSLLNSKIISLNKNQKLTPSSIIRSNDQQKIFQKELLPKFNLPYTITKRTGLLNEFNKTDNHLNKNISNNSTLKKEFSSPINETITIENNQRNFFFLKSNQTEKPFDKIQLSENHKSFNPTFKLIPDLTYKNLSKV